MSKRKRIEKYIIDLVGKLPKGSVDNVKAYKALFKSMSDKDFSEYMGRLKDGKYIHYILPNGSPVTDIRELESIANGIGISLFNRVYFEDAEGEFMPSQKYLVGYVPTKVTKQSVSYAIKTAKHTKSRNALSGQVTGDSKGASITQPESQLFLAHGLKNTLDELANVRSSDVDASNAYVKYLEKYGSVKLSEIDLHRADNTRSMQVLKGLFMGMHMKLDVDKDGVRQIRKIR